jgi:hypothetical protein
MAVVGPLLRQGTRRQGSNRHRTKIDRMRSRRDLPLCEQLLWRMRYETASRAAAVFQLNIEGYDFDRCALSRSRTATSNGSSGAAAPY